MPKISILKKRSEFVDVSKRGKSIATKGLVLQCLKKEREFVVCGKGDAVFSVGFTATKKLGNAVVRNRVKRRFRALALDVFDGLAMNDCDYVLIGRFHSYTRLYSALKKDLIYALHEVHKEQVC